MKHTITKTYLYNFDPLKPHFYTVKLGFTGIYIILLISALKHRLWVLVRGGSIEYHNLCFEQKHKKYQNFYLKTFACFRNEDSWSNSILNLLSTNQISLN